MAVAVLSELHVMPGHLFRQESEAVLETLEAERATHTCKLASEVWPEMQERGILPTPRNYDLWYTYRADMNPALTQRMRALLDLDKALTPAVLNGLYDEFVATAELNIDAISQGSGEIQETAQTLIEQVADGQTAFANYGDTLTDWAQHLGDQPTLAGLVDAIASITVETTKASERNRLLEQQLSAAANKIAKLRQSLMNVKQEATTDVLTGLANRRAFDTRIKRFMAQVRSDPTTPLSLLLIDVDHFKIFNDAHGHKVGDLVLRLVARMLADSVKGRDTVARYGGEEFAIVLAGADLHAASTVARQIGDTLCSKRLVTKGSGQSVGRITVSTGVAQARPGETAAALIERADVALYQAKRDGRNRVCTERTASGGEHTIVAVLG